MEQLKVLFIHDLKHRIAVFPTRMNRTPVFSISRASPLEPLLAIRKVNCDSVKSMMNQGF